MANPFYIDNVIAFNDDTIYVRGNEVSDLTGNNATAFKISNIKNLRVTNNKAIRIRSPNGNAKGFDFSNIEDAQLVYNVSSRTNTGFLFSNDVLYLLVYNLTAHNCNTGVNTASQGTFRNIAFSAYQDSSLYRISNGFTNTSGTNINIDYVMHFGLANLVSSGTAVMGDNITENQILYMDEPNDDLTPDYISELVNAGTDNPIDSEYIDIGGIKGPVTSEQTAELNYWYDLIDNSFWDIENMQAAEVSFIKAFQSRVLAGTEVEINNISEDARIKTANSLERFSELYPMYARYANQSDFKKRVMDMWYAGQNPAVIQSYQNSIGGYNYLPSFFKRMEDYEDGWVIGVSYVAYDNWLNSMEDLKYGIAIDFLGTMTMNQATSGECYNNVMKSVADIAPVRWFLHDEVEPTGYVMFADMYHGFEDCQLSNMRYNDDFYICVDELGQDGQLITPLISTISVTTSGVSGNVEVSLLDRVYSENITREVYYRQGTSIHNMSAWEEFTDPIGGVLEMISPYVQFKINVENVIRLIDYEFMGIALRTYTSLRDWTRPQSG